MLKEPNLVLITLFLNDDLLHISETRNPQRQMHNDDIKENKLQHVSSQLGKTEVFLYLVKYSFPLISLHLYNEEILPFEVLLLSNDICKKI